MEDKNAKLAEEFQVRKEKVRDFVYKLNRELYDEPEYREYALIFYDNRTAFTIRRVLNRTEVAGGDAQVSWVFADILEPIVYAPLFDIFRSGATRVEEGKTINFYYV